MEGLVKKIKGIRNEMIGLSIVLMLAGIFMILFPNTSGNIICRGVGAVLCIWGVVRLVAYFRNNEILGSFGLVQGVALAGFGLYILIRPGIIEVFLTTVFAIIIIVDGILKLQYALDFRKLDAGGWWIEAEKLTGDNIYKVLIYFDQLYGKMNDREKRQLIEELISEIQIYPERQPNGQWLKSIKFRLPIIEEDMNISLDNEQQVETVARLERS